MKTESNSKKLLELKVVDLRIELEKRGLDKIGVRADLIERLKKALIEEGNDPEKYEFDLKDKSLKMLTPEKDSRENSVEKKGVKQAESIIDTILMDIDMIEDIENKEESSEENIAKDVLNYPQSEEEKMDCDDKQDETDRNENKKITLTNNNDENIDNLLEVQDDLMEEATHEEMITQEKNVKLKLKSEADSSTSIKRSPSVKASTSSSKIDNMPKTARNTLGRTLWITNLLPSTRARELKHLLSPYGRVILAKVVQSSRFPSQRCYGYVTMDTIAAADLCIKKLNNTELKGNIIRVVKVKLLDHTIPAKAKKQAESKDKVKKKKEVSQKNDLKKSPEKKANDKKSAEKKSNTNKSPERKNEIKKPVEKKKVASKKPTGENRKDSLSKSELQRQRRANESLLRRIREERDCQRRDLELLRREEERRRREIQRIRESEKQIREETRHIEREKEKLRTEREQIEKERQEIIKLERERQRIEREKLEQEKLELRRQKLQIQEAKSVKKPALEFDRADCKRISPKRRYDGTPSPPKFQRDASPETSNKRKPKAYKSRNEDPKYKVKHSSKYSSYARNRRETSLSNVSSPRASKERFRDFSEDRSPVSYRAKNEPEHHQPKSNIRSGRAHHRIDTPIKQCGQYREDNWYPSTVAPVKSFTDSPGPAGDWQKNENWRPKSIEKSSNERWANNPSRIVGTDSSIIPSTSFMIGNSTLPGIQPKMPCQGSTYSGNRFEPYKTGNSWRKY